MNAQFRCWYAVRVALLAVAASGAAFGGDAVNITVTNNTTDDLRVTLYDQNAHPAQVILAKHVINGFASINLSITADAAGLGRLSWTANTLGGGTMRRCGKGEQPGLGSGDNVDVAATTSCPAPIK